MSEIGGDADTYEGTESETETGGVTDAAASVEAGSPAGEISSTAPSGTELPGTANETGFSVEKGAGEIQVNAEQTSHGMNQILETPNTLEAAQITVEHYHNQSIAQILDMKGQYMSEEDRGRVSGGVNAITAVEHNPNSGYTGLYSTHNGRSSIEVSALSRDQMERTTTHETNHFASKNQEIIVPMPEKNGYMVHQTVGMRHSSWFHDNATGRISGYETKGKGLNEGMTTLYTNEQLSARSKEKGDAAERSGVYAHAAEVCKQFEETMGKDALGNAYYGGKTMELQEKMDAMGGKGTFEQFQSSMDKTISNDYNERVEGMKEAQEILARLDEISKGEKEK